MAAISQFSDVQFCVVHVQLCKELQFSLHSLRAPGISQRQSTPQAGTQPAAQRPGHDEAPLHMNNEHLKA